MVNPGGGKAGFTLTELLIACLLVTVVFAAGIAIYTSGLKFLSAAKAKDITATVEVAVESVVKKITLANSADPDNDGVPNLTQGGSQLNIRVDYTCAGAMNANSANNFADDNWWHYRFINSQLVSGCDNNPNTVLTPPGTTLLDNLDTTGAVPACPPGTGTGASGFQICNPSGVGSATVIYMHINSTLPVKELNTEVALGASAKR